MRKFFALNDSYVDLLPKRETAQSAGYDLKARMNDTVPAGQWLLVKTGVTVQLLPDEYIQVCSRSGLALREGVFVLNAPGIVDADYYPNEIGVILYNANPEKPFIIRRGDRIAQAIFGKFLVTSDDKATGERISGFGHTGNK